jgi:hypothetical protein
LNVDKIHERRQVQMNQMRNEQNAGKGWGAMAAQNAAAAGAGMDPNMNSGSEGMGPGMAPGGMAPGGGGMAPGGQPPLHTAGSYPQMTTGSAGQMTTQMNAGGSYSVNGATPQMVDSNGHPVTVPMAQTVGQTMAQTMGPAGGSGNPYGSRNSGVHQPHLVYGGKEPGKDALLYHGGKGMQDSGKDPFAKDTGKDQNLEMLRGYAYTHPSIPKNSETQLVIVLETLRSV